MSVKDVEVMVKNMMDEMNEVKIDMVFDNLQEILNRVNLEN